MTTQKAVPPAAPQPATDCPCCGSLNWFNVPGSSGTYRQCNDCRCGWRPANRRAAPQPKKKLLPESAREAREPTEYEILRGHHRKPAPDSVAPTLSGSGESSSPSVGSSVADLKASRLFLLEQYGHAWNHVHSELDDLLCEALYRLSAAPIDARRYQWWSQAVFYRPSEVAKLLAPVTNTHDLNAAIDAAMGSATNVRPLGTGRQR